MKASTVNFDLKEARKKRGWTLRDMAIMTGLTPAHLCRIENGRQKLTEKAAAAILPVFDIGPPELSGPIMLATLRDEKLLEVVKWLVGVWRETDSDDKKDQIRQLMFSIEDLLRNRQTEIEEFSTKPTEASKTN